MPGDNASRTRRGRPIAAIACCLLGFPLCGVNLPGDDQLIQLLFPPWPASAGPTSSLWSNMGLLECFKCIPAVCIDSSRCRNVDDTVYLDWLLISLIECEFPTVFLILDCIAFRQTRPVLLLGPPYGFLTRTSCYALLRSPSDQLLTMLFVFWLLMVRRGNRTIKTVVSQCWDIEDPFCMGAPAKCAGFFNCFDVLGLPLLLWAAEGLEWLALVARDVNEAEWLKPIAVCCRLFISLE